MTISSRARVLGASIVIAATLVTGCSSTAGSPTTPAAPPGFAAPQALTWVRPDTTGILALDHQRIKKRWGVADLTSESSKDAITTYVKKSVQDRFTSSIGNVLQPMMQQWGWSALDLDWEVELQGPGAPVRVYKLRDSLSMQVVEKSLTDNNFTRSEASNGGIRFNRDLKKMSGPPVFLAGVTVFPDRHLLVAGPADVVAGLSDASEQQPDVADLLKSIPQAEMVLAAWGSGACVRGSRKSPRQADEQPALGEPTAWVAAMKDSAKAEIAARYSSDEQAAADLPARQKLFADGNLLTGIPVSKMLTATIAQQGPTLRYDAEVLRAGALLQMWFTAGAPWAQCGTRN